MDISYKWSQFPNDWSGKRAAIYSNYLVISQRKRMDFSDLQPLEYRAYVFIPFFALDIIRNRPMASHNYLEIIFGILFGGDRPPIAEPDSTE
jgi:hypothetical protein